MRQDKTPGMTFESVSMCQQTKIEGGALRRRFKEKKEGSKEGKKEREQLGGKKTPAINERCQKRLVYSKTEEKQ